MSEIEIVFCAMFIIVGIILLSFFYVMVKEGIAEENRMEEDSVFDYE